MGRKCEFRRKVLTTSILPSCPTLLGTPSPYLSSAPYFPASSLFPVHRRLAHLRLRMRLLLGIAALAQALRPPLRPQRSATPNLPNAYVLPRSLHNAYAHALADAPAVAAPNLTAVLNVTAEKTPPKEEKKPPKKGKALTLKQLKAATGLAYADEYGEYDVPIVDTPMWFRLNVKRNSEKRMQSTLLALADHDHRWRVRVR